MRTLIILLLPTTLLAEPVQLMLPDSSTVIVEMRRPLPHGTEVMYQGQIARVTDPSHTDTKHLPILLLVAGFGATFYWAFGRFKGRKLIETGKGEGETTQTYNEQLGRHVSAMGRSGEVEIVTNNPESGEFETYTEHPDGTKSYFSLKRGK